MLKVMLRRKSESFRSSVKLVDGLKMNTKEDLKKWRRFYVFRFLPNCVKMSMQPTLQKRFWLVPVCGFPNECNMN